MVLLFPDPDTFHLVLTGGFLPPEVTLAPTTVGFAADGGVSVAVAGKLAKKASAELARLGVTAAKKHPGPAEAVSCWPQILPAVRDPHPPQLSSQAPVLFELADPTDLPTFVKEMLRLGNDRQAVRWLTADGDRSTDRVLLRVIGPPYYTLLRAIDPAAGAKGSVRAYVEQAPRVWVQVGYSHPLAPQIKLDDGQLLLIRPPRGWAYVPDVPFQDVYDVLDFELPATTVDWAESAARERVAVPLRLVPGNAADAPELWILRGDAAGRLDGFVRDADERVLQRLRFAVAADAAGGTVVVLRVTTAKTAPPVLPIPGAVGFKPSHKLPNLFVPAGTRLHPMLRRDAVRKLLAADPDHLVWLAPGPDGAYTPETIPENAFRPLEDWVDYVIETNHAPLAEWVGASRFDFEPFVCTDTPPKPPADAGDRDKGKRRPAPLGPATPPAPAADSRTKKAAAAGPPSQPFDAPPTPKAPDEWEVRRKELEARFLAVDGPLDHPDRQSLWPELAVANAGHGDTAEAAVCWLNALWGADPLPATWVNGWLRTEFPALQLPVPAAEFDRRAAAADPTPGEARQFAALVVWLATQDPPPPWFSSRLAAAQRYLDAYERKIPVRAAWLAATHLAARTGSDPLGLARARDRLLLRLLESGVSAEKDLPAFLRFAGRNDSDDVRTLHGTIGRLHRDVRGWLEASLDRNPGGADREPGRLATLAYADLFFAFGSAKLGDADAARALVDSARRALDRVGTAPDRAAAADVLFKAFQYRVEQAIVGEPHLGLLPADVLGEFGRIEAKAADPDRSLGLASYAIARLREQCRILEPQEKLDPYLKQTSVDPLRKALADLPAVHNPQALARAVRDLYHKGATGGPTADSKLLVLTTALPLAARVGESFTLELLGLLPEALAAARSLNSVGPDRANRPGVLFEAGLFLAGHFDRRDLLQSLVDQLVGYLRTLPDDARLDLVNVVAKQCVRSLRKLGLWDDIGTLLHRLYDLVLGAQPAEQVRAKSAGKPDRWARALQTLLNLAGGWAAIGQTERAAPILEFGREELSDRGRTPFLPAQVVGVARAYLAAVSHLPTADGLARIAELFLRLDPGRVTDSRSTGPYYSWLHLNLAEDAVSAVVSDDSSLAAAGRRWLEDDELIVRRRIHRDMRRALDRGGL